MVYIKKGFEPNELLVAKKSGIRRYDDLRSDVREAIKKALYLEQKGICAYCMCRLKGETMQVEHYIPQHDQQGNYNEALSVDFYNMLAVCPGRKNTPNASYNVLTCDQHKGNQILTVDPRNEYSVGKIKYDKAGIIYSTDSNIDYDLNVVLNLNCDMSQLPRNRKSMLDRFLTSIRKKYSGKEITKAEWKKLRDKYATATDRDGLLPEFIGIVLRYIDQKLQ